MVSSEPLCPWLRAQGCEQGAAQCEALGPVWPSPYVETVWAGGGLSSAGWGGDPGRAWGRA